MTSFLIGMLALLYGVAPAAIFLPLFVVGPLVARPLMNHPFYTEEGKVKPSTFGFFTELQPGWIKIVERGKRFIRCIMRNPGHRFDNTKGVPVPDAWQVIETAGNEHDTYPIHRNFKWWKCLYLPYHFLWYWWKIWVYSMTGMVFTGIPPFQTVRIYPIHYFRQASDSDGKARLIEKSNFTNYFSALPINFYVYVEGSDTKDKLPVTLLILCVIRIINPYKAAYYTDGWPTRFEALVKDAVNAYTREKSLDDILATRDQGLIEAVEALKSALADFGIELTKVSIPDRSIVTEEEMSVTQRKLAAVALAKPAADARVIQAQGEADALATMAKAIEDGGDAARLAMMTEARVRVATAAGDRAVVILGDQTPDQTTAALLAKMLQNQNNTRGGNP